MKVFWHRSPFVRLLIPFSIGIIIGLRTPFGGRDALLICVLVSLLIAVLLIALRSAWRNMHFRPYFGVLLTCLLGLLGYTTIQIKFNSPQWTVPDAKYYQATVHSFPDPKTKTYALELKVHQWMDSLGNTHPTDMKILAYVRKDSVAAGLAPGDELVFRGRISADEKLINPGQFDYAQYLTRMGITGTIFLSEKHYAQVERQSRSVFLAIKRLRAQLIQNWYLNEYDDRENGVIAALILGDRSHLDEDLRADFTGAGAVHVLAVSGLHVGIVYLFVLSVLKFIFRGPRFRSLNLALVLLVLWFYAAITGFSPSVLRASTMFSFIAVGKFHGRQPNTYNMICASAFFLLAIDPFLIGQVGFQLSYLAVLGIVFLYPGLYGMATFNTWLGDKLWSLFIVSVSAQIATFPLSVHYFHQFPSYFFLSNLVVIPLAWVILHAGVIWLLTFSVPVVGEVFAFITNWAAKFLNDSVEMVVGLPGAVMDGAYFADYTGLLVYLFLLVLVSFFIRPTRMRLRLTYVLGFALLLVHAHKFVERRNQAKFFFPVGTQVPTAVEINGSEATVYLAQDMPEIRAGVGYLIDGYLSAHGVREVDWMEIPRCDYPASCMRHPVHGITGDEVMALDAGEMENSAIYVGHGEEWDALLLGAYRFVISEEDAHGPAELDGKWVERVHALDKEGALAMHY